MHDENSINTNLMVDLDCILDTRHPVLYALDETTAMSMLDDDSYRKRVADQFGNISSDIFRVYYDNRSKSILKLATPTPMLEMIKEYADAAVTNVLNAKDNIIPTIYLNVYPYELNGDEMLALGTMLHKVIDNVVNIEVVDMDYDKLSPSFVYNNLSNLIKYDIVQWLEYHTAVGNLSKQLLLEVACTGPLIATGNISTSKITQDTFESIRALLGPVTNLVLIQSRMFSTI